MRKKDNVWKMISLYDITPSSNDINDLIVLH